MYSGVKRREGGFEHELDENPKPLLAPLLITFLRIGSIAGLGNSRMHKNSLFFMSSV